VRHIFIELSENTVRFFVNSRDLIQTFEFTFTDKKDYRYKEQLDDFLEQAGLKLQDFEECTISWSSFRSTLIPSNIFSESNPEALFSLCYGKEIPLSHVDYNRIPEQGIVNLFEIPLWVKSFFVIRFPRSVIQHEGSHLIRGMFAEPSFKLKAQLLVYANYFVLAIVKENKLQFYSMFNYQENDDIVYNFMFSLQQKEYMGEISAIQVFPGVGSSNANCEDLVQNLRSLSDLKKASITVNTDFILNSQKRCV
jgi:hypothetical protein